MTIKATAILTQVFMVMSIVHFVIITILSLFVNPVYMKGIWTSLLWFIPAVVFTIVFIFKVSFKEEMEEIGESIGGAGI